MADPVQPEWISFLASTEIFHGVAEEALRDLAGELVMVDFAAGETLFQQGDPGDSMYLIVSGEASVVGSGPDGKPRQLALIGPGRDVGELALWVGDRRSATVRTVVPTRAARLTREAFTRFTQRHPDVVAGIDRHVGRRLRHAQLGRALHASGLFGELQEGVLRELEALLEPVWIEGGSTVFRQGDEGDALYLVISGLVQVLLEQAGGEPRILAALGPGEIFGEMALLEHEPRSATVRALRDSQLARLARADCERLLARRPEALLVVTRKLVARLRTQNAGPRRPNRALTTIAVVPAAEGVPASDFCGRLAASLRAHGPTLEVSSAWLEAHVGHLGAAQAAQTEAGHGRLMELLGKLEADHRFVIYQADASESAWTARCLRQSDHVLIAATAASDPRPGAAELAAERALRQRPGSRASLVLLHPDGSREAAGTSQWLAARNVDRHHHVRLDAPRDFDRLARSLAGRAVGLVLGGGAARAFAHAGVIRALQEAHIPIDIVGGTSAGGVFAATCAREFGYEQSIETVTGGIAAMLANFTIPLVSLASGRDAIPFLRKAVGDMQIEDLWLRYFCVSANLTRASVQVHDRGSLGRSLLATGRLPAILPPLLWDGDLLVDGGIIDNVPVDVMRRYPDCGTVIACDVSPAYDPPEVTPFGDSLSGWHVLRQLVKPKTKRERFPGVLAVLLRTMEFGGAAYKSETIGDADFYLTPPVAPFKMNEFERGPEIAEVGYRYAAPKIAEWAQGKDLRTAQLADRPGIAAWPSSALR